MATNKMAPTHKQGNLRRDLFSHNFNINDLAFFLSLSLSHTHSFSLTHTHFHSLSLPLNLSLSHSLSQICSFHGRQCEIINSSSYLFEAKTNGLNLNFKMLLWNLFFEASENDLFQKNASVRVAEESICLLTQGSTGLTWIGFSSLLLIATC